MDFPRKQSPVLSAINPLSFACSHGLGMLHNLHYSTGSTFRFSFIFLAVSYNVNYVKYSLRPRCQRFFEQVCEEVVILKAVGTRPHPQAPSATF